MRILLVSLPLWFAVAIAAAQGIEGAAERYRFEPGDRVIYQSNLQSCPVGEFLEGWTITRGAYECARFRDRMWIRPLDNPTVLALRFPEPLPEEFSLEFPVWTAEAGCPFVEFRLHEAAHMPKFENNDIYAYGAQAFLGGHIACHTQPTSFGSRDTPGEVRFELRTRTQEDAIHRIAVQVRRGQVRFYLDGKRIGHRPFRPDGPIGGISLYFHKHFETSEPYADAPALVGDLRIAAYTQPETAPTAEQDLIRELGAVDTPDGLKVTLSEAVLFEFGKWDLKPEARPTLEKLARLARLRPGAIRVEGHTDNVGTERFNQVLSELRARVVALELARLGVDPKRLVARGYGPSRPVAPNDSDENRARNRRVEIILEKR